jgi:hypothetical protein
MYFYWSIFVFVPCFFIDLVIFHIHVRVQCTICKVSF